MLCGIICPICIRLFLCQTVKEHGYADIVYLPDRHSGKPALVIELKWNKTADGAIQQIRERNYPQVLEKFTHDILLMGINYDAKTKKHTCKIERYQNQ